MYNKAQQPHKKGPLLYILWGSRQGINRAVTEFKCEGFMRAFWSVRGVPPIMLDETLNPKP